MAGMPAYLLQAPNPPAPGLPQAPGTPGTIAPPATPGPSTDFPTPRTARELEILKAIREQISSQIENVRSRRGTIARQYENASGANRAGLEQQLRILDQRIAQLELDLDASGRALYRATPGVATQAPGFPGRFPGVGSGQLTAISIVFIVTVLGPLALAMSKALWRRTARPALPPGWNDASHRLERLEQAVDTIAVEMERVSEGQRFITKILTQREGSLATAGGASGTDALNGGQPLPALGAGSPEPIVLQNQRDEVRVRRS